MAYTSGQCTVSTGRKEVCKESVGGLQGVYFLNFYTGSATLDANDLVTALNTSGSAYYYELKGNSSYTETVNTSRDNGTTFFSQELTLNLKKLTNEMTTQLKLMAYGRPKIVIWTLNGEALLVGNKEGCDVTAGTIQTGGALGDLFGYSITFTGMEQQPGLFLSGSTVNNPFAGLTIQPTIVYGS